MHHAILADALDSNDDIFVTSGNSQLLIDSCESDAIQKMSFLDLCPLFTLSKKLQLVVFDCKRH